jgi:uncharacterized protein (DUF58 family)
VSSDPRQFQFDGVVRITRIGAGYLIFTVVLGFAAINTGNNSIYIGLAFMLGCLLLSGIASKGGLKHLRVEFVSVEEAWAGVATSGLLRIENDSSIWRVRDLVMTSPELAHPIYLPLVDRRRDQLVPALFLFRLRGAVDLKQLDLYTRYPFGLFLKKRRVRLAGHLVVYPRLNETTPDRERFRIAEGDNGSTNRIGSGSDVHGFRDYVVGDSLRQIHWKKSASVGRWVMKQSEAETGRIVYIVVDPFVPRDAAPEALESVISAAATHAHDALERELEVILKLPGITIRGRAGEARRAIFEALALAEPTSQPMSVLPDPGAVVYSVRGAHESKSA